MLEQKIDALTASMNALTAAILSLQEHGLAVAAPEAAPKARKTKKGAEETANPSQIADSAPAAEAPATAPEIVSSPACLSEPEAPATSLVTPQAVTEIPAPAPITYDQVRDAAIACSEKLEYDAMAELLSRLGVTRVPHIKEEQYADALEMFTTSLFAATAVQ